MKPEVKSYSFKTELTVPKVGVMIVGLGGNNGSTAFAGVVANRKNLSWHTKEGVQVSDYLGIKMTITHMW